MKCTEANARLQELLAGGLDAGRERDVRAHLAACPACENELSLYWQVFSALETEGLPDVHLTDAIMRKAAAEGLPLRRTRLASLAAAASVLLAMTLYLVFLRDARPATLAGWLASWAPEEIHGWTAAAGDAWASTATRLTTAYLAATEPSWLDSLATLDLVVTLPSLPASLTLAICVLAAAVNVCCLRTPRPVAPGLGH